MSDMETKICSKCGRELPISEFYKNKQANDGLTCRCRSCQKEANRVTQEKKFKKMLSGNGLSAYTPRELMQELFNRGYRGTLEYTEVHKIDISNF